MNVFSNEALAYSKDTHGESNMKLFKRASKLLDFKDIDKLASLNLNFANKRKSIFLPKRAKTILPKINQQSSKQSRQLNSVLTFLISAVIIAGSIYECEINPSSHISQNSNIFRISLAGLALIQICLVVSYTYSILKVKKSYKILSKHSAVYQDRALLIQMLAEIFICVLIVPPYFTYQFAVYQLSISQIITVDVALLGLIFLRVLHLYKLYFEFSYFNSIKSKFYCDLLHLLDSFKFTMKCFLKDMPYVSILIMFTLSTMFCGILLHLYERTVSGSPFVYIWNGFWLISYTQPTIGYGDMTPATHLGRLSVILSIFIGLFMYSYTVLIVKNSTLHTVSELKLYSKIKYKCVGVNKLIKFSIVLLQRWWRLTLKRFIRTNTINDVYRFHKQLIEFSFQRLKELQEINPMLTEEVKRISELPLKRLQNLIEHLNPIVESSVKATRVANRQYGTLRKIKKLNKGLRKMFGVEVKREGNKLEPGNKLQKVSSCASNVMLKKMREGAVKKMILNKIEKTSISVMHSSKSSDDDFYSNRMSSVSRMSDTSNVSKRAQFVKHN